MNTSSTAVAISDSTSTRPCLPRTSGRVRAFAAVAALTMTSLVMGSLVALFGDPGAAHMATVATLCPRPSLAGAQLAVTMPRGSLSQSPTQLIARLGKSSRETEPSALEATWDTVLMAG